MKNILEKVKQFQIASGQPVNETPTVGKWPDNQLRYSLMREENKEYKVACGEEDKIEILDAVVDQLYILAGTINKHGLQNLIDEAFERVHENNMTKVVNGKVLRDPDGKILKPAGFKKVDLTDLFQ